MKITRLFLLLLASLVSSCNANNRILKEYKADDSTIVKIYATENDSFDSKAVYYYPSGKEKEIRFEKNGSPEGPDVEFYEDGKKKSTGQYLNGKRDGKFEYYFPSGALRVIRYYIPFRDTNIGKLNEEINFNEKGDTLKSKSVYLEKYYSNDTLNDGETFFWKIKSPGHLFDKAIIRYGNFDSVYRLIDSANFESFRFDSFDLTLGTKKYKKGLNSKRGVVMFYNDSFYRYEVYFTVNFFVK